MVKKLFIFLVSLIPVTALAGFQVVEDAAKPVPTTGTGVSTSPAPTSSPLPKTVGAMHLVALTYIGEPDADIPVISGFGRDLKLSDAIKQIVPAGWHAFLKEDTATRVSKLGPVSWRGGRRWIEVLDILANEQNLAIEVDWKKKYLYVGERKISTSAVAAGEITNKPKVVSWTLKEGHTVGREIQAWAKSAGWKVVWNLAKDWSVPASTTFTGDFKSAATEVIKTLSSNGVLIRAQFYDGNKTMVVTGPGVAEQ